MHFLRIGMEIEEQFPSVLTEPAVFLIAVCKPLVGKPAIGVFPMNILSGKFFGEKTHSVESGRWLYAADIADCRENIPQFSQPTVCNASASLSHGPWKAQEQWNSGASFKGHGFAD